MHALNNYFSYLRCNNFMKSPYLKNFCPISLIKATRDYLSMASSFGPGYTNKGKGKVAPVLN